jgi:hypothetical protein
VVYRDAKRMAFAKKVKIDKFIRNREYRLIKDKGGRIDLLLPSSDNGMVHMDFVPAKRQRLKEMDFDLSTLELTSPAARGARMAPKPIGKVKHISAKDRATKGDGKSSPENAGAEGKKSRRGQGDLF